MTVNCADERRSPGNCVLLRAVLDSGGARIPVRVSNLSRYGVLALGDAFPAEGADVIFRYKTAAIPSWIAWVGCGCAGVQFADAVPLSLFSRDASHEIAIMRDTRVVDFRRPGFRGNQMTPGELAVVAEWMSSRRN